MRAKAEHIVHAQGQMEKMGATEAGEGEGVVRGQRREERRDRSSFQVTDQKGKKKEERKIEG
jgi:hypothetical protein